MSKQRVREPGASDSIEQEGFFETDEAVELYMERIADPTFFPQEEKAIDRHFTDTDCSVLDVGCGIGRVSRLLHSRGFDVTGIDISEPFVDRARSLFPDLEFRVEDVTDTSFPSESFDYAIFSFYGLDYVLPKSEREAALREIHRLLKPAGIFVFSTHNSWHPLVPTSVRDILSCGYDVMDLYLRKENRKRLFSRYKIENVPLGDIEIYLSNPVHQVQQLRKCGYTPLDIVGNRDGPLRFFERQPHFVAKKE